MPTDQKLPADSRDVQEVKVDADAADDTENVAPGPSPAESLKRKRLDRTPAPSSKKLKAPDEGGDVVGSIRWAENYTTSSVAQAERGTNVGRRTRKKKAGVGDGVVDVKVDGDGQSTDAVVTAKPSTKNGKPRQLGKLRGKYNVKPNNTPAADSSRRRRARQNPGARLRVNRKVVTKVPLDIWRLILSFCPPRFLGKARLISKDFHRVLTY
ncbi:hypothetical protein GP486_007152, partial [Trichoglossum hirsutum]